METEDEALAFPEEICALTAWRVITCTLMLRAGGAGAQGRVRYSDDGEPQKTAGLPRWRWQHAGLTDDDRGGHALLGAVLLGTGGPVRDTQATQAGIEAVELGGVAMRGRLRAAYGSTTSQLARIAPDCGAKVLDTVYDDAVTLRLRACSTARAPLLKITELERGCSACASAILWRLRSRFHGY